LISAITLSESIRLGGLVSRSFDLEGNLIGLLAKGIPWKRAILVLVFGAQEHAASSIYQSIFASSRVLFLGRRFTM
jgi:hypothetical protein